MVNVLKENIKYHIIKRIGQVRDSRRNQKKNRAKTSKNITFVVWEMLDIK